jgi:hypothetical protein
LSKLEKEYKERGVYEFKNEKYQSTKDDIRNNIYDKYEGTACDEDQDGLSALNSMLCYYEITPLNKPEKPVMEDYFPCFDGYGNNYTLKSLLSDWMKK